MPKLVHDLPNVRTFVPTRSSALIEGLILPIFFGAFSLIVALIPQSSLGQDCGSVLHRARSTLQEEFGPMMDHACRQELDKTMWWVLILASIAVTLFWLALKMWWDQGRTAGTDAADSSAV